MSILSKVTSGKQIRPPRIIFYGTQGIGKTTFGATLPSPIFVPTEDGLANIETSSFPVSRTYQEFMGYLNALIEEKHNYKTVVIDSLDWLENLVHEYVARDNKVVSIENIGYAKGYIFALVEWQKIKDALDILRDQKNMIVCCLAHSAVKKYNPPDTESYDRYQLDLHAKAAALFGEWCDMQLFAHYEVSVLRTSDKSGNATIKAIGDGKRSVKTTERPSWAAKNRYSMEDEIEYNKTEELWPILKGYIVGKKEKENV